MVAGVMDRNPAPLAHPTLDRIVRRCLAKEPDQRFQTARDLKAALVWALEEPGAPARRSPRHSAAVSVAVAIGILAVGWAAGRYSTLHPPRRVHSFLVAPSPQGFRCLGDDAGP